MEFINLALTIQQNLLRRGRTVLPGLGVFHLVYKPAKLQRQEGVVLPPVEEPTFELQDSQGAVEFDPELINDFREASGIPQEDLARNGLKEQILIVKDMLSDGESVHLPDVGRLTLSKAGEAVFHPDDFNYYLEVYGLGSVTARPVLRRTPEEAARVAQEGRAKIIVKPPAKPVRTWKDRLFLPGLAALLILSLAGCLWLIFTPDPSSSTSITAPMAMEDADYDEANPGTTPGDVTEDILGDPDIETEPTEPEAEAVIPEERVPEEPVQKPEQSKSVVRIAVGHFGQAGNATLLIERLSKAGLSAVSEPAREGLTRVVVEVDPTARNPREVLALLQKDYEPTAWIVSQ